MITKREMMRLAAKAKKKQKIKIVDPLCYDFRQTVLFKDIPTSDNTVEAFTADDLKLPFKDVALCVDWVNKDPETQEDLKQRTIVYRAIQLTPNKIKCAVFYLENNGVDCYLAQEAMVIIDEDGSISMEQYYPTKQLAYDMCINEMMTRRYNPAIIHAAIKDHSNIPSSILKENMDQFNSITKINKSMFVTVLLDGLWVINNHERKVVHDPRVKLRKTLGNVGEKTLEGYIEYSVDINKPKYTANKPSGTHSSPHEHERRGHYRTSKNGVRYWVKSTTVNKDKNPNLSVDKDYCM